MRKEAWAWCGYDFANTIYSMLVVTLAFPVLLNNLFGKDTPTAIGNSVSMFLVVLTLPMLGVVADKTGNGRRYLLWTTVACCVFVALLGPAHGLWSLVVIFALANYFYQLGLVFYNSMLPQVSAGGEEGVVSGWGVSLGYVGALVSILVFMSLQDRIGLRGAFYLAAGLFFFTALPTFFLIKAPARPGRASWSMMADGWRRVLRTLGKVARSPLERNFFIGRFFYAEVLNTITIFMTVYAKNRVGIPEHELPKVWLLLIAAAAIGSAIVGYLVRRRGALPVLLAIIVLWLGVFVGLILFPSKVIFFVLGCVAGALLGGVWVSDRLVLMSIAPAESLNEYFGFYGLVGKVSAVVGPLVFALTSDSFGYAWGLASMLLMFLLGLCFLLLFRRAVRE